MARKSYYKPYRRSYRSKAHWASNFTNSNLTIGSSSDHAEAVLVSNSTQSSSPTPVTVKAGNFKVQGDCYVTVSQGTPGRGIVITLYIIYLPEVVVAQANPVTTINDHPEWIMAWKVLDFNPSTTTAADTNSFSFSSRLKRNLNSGDTIALVAVAENTAAETVYIRAKSQYFTRAN